MFQLKRHLAEKIKLVTNKNIIFQYIIQIISIEPRKAVDVATVNKLFVPVSCGKISEGKHFFYYLNIMYENLIIKYVRCFVVEIKLFLGNVFSCKILQKFFV